MVEKNKYFSKVAWIHIKNRQVLVARSKGNSIFFLPGGGPEGNETKEQALIRQLKEELSIDVKNETIGYVGSFEAPSFEFPETIFVRMDCFTADYSGKLVPSSEVTEIAWFNHKDREKISAVDKAVFDYLKQRSLID